MPRFVAVVLALTLAASTSAGAVDQRVSFAFSGPMPRLLSALGQSFGRNIVADPALAQTNATITLHDVTFAQALQTIERTYHLYEQQVGGAIYLSVANASSQGVMVTFQLHNASAAVVAPAIEKAVDNVGTVIPDTRLNAVIYTGDPAGLSLVRKLVQTLDTGVGSDGIQSITIPLKHTDTETAATALRTALGTTDAIVVEKKKANELLVTGSGGALAQARSIVADLDTPGKQVDVTVTVYDVTPRNDAKNIGITIGGNNSFGTTGGASGSSSAATFAPNLFDLAWPLKKTVVNAQLNALISQGTATVLASPNTVVEAGETGKILVGETYPSVFQNGGLAGGTTVTTVNAGIILDVTPRFIGADGTVELKIHAEYSQITGFIETYPILGSRSVDTLLLAKSGEQITFGGLTKSAESATTTKVPLLGDIPLFGKLFRNTQTTNLNEQIIFRITPTIIQENG